MLDKSFNPKISEQKHYLNWEREGLFAADPKRDAPPFTIMMPPPNVTGSLHMGHALNMTLQDILTRYYRMNGRDVLWQPGTDHAGIATQMVVERLLDKEGLTRKKLGRAQFLERVWQWKAESGGAIVAQLRRLGATPDWDRERFTMDEGMSRAVRKAFVQLYNEGLIYRDKRLVNWDPKLHTSISDLEVEQKEKKGHLWHIRYPVEGAEEEFIVVATTRPETMLGDTAVAVNPEDERYTHLIGKSVSLPLTDRMIPIIADDYADPEQGSGAVKITPAHDFNDFEVGRRHDLPMINIFDINACLNENAGEDYRGLDRVKARKKILAELEAMDLIVKVEDIKHTVPHGDRSGEIIEPYLTDQWYCNAPTLAQPAIRAVEEGRTVFVPKSWENTYFEWMKNIQPWCISRQLWWGHQIPAWFGPDGHVFVAEDETDAAAQAQIHYGETRPLKRDPDVLDTWFSSALWPFSTLGWPDATPELARYYPGDVLVTGFDIIFFWVARMMMMGLHFMGDVPFRTVYMHALVRDASGAKMSKSKGNVMDPLELIDQYGADALRFTMAAMAAQGRDIKLSKDRIEGYRNFTTKLWNAARYCEMNNCLPSENFNPATVKANVNLWIIGELKKTAQSMDAAIAAFKFNEFAGAIYQFVWGNFCDWYLEFTKPLLAQDNDAAAETRATTGWVLDQILILLSPLMPFITEELHGALTSRGTLLSKSAWPSYADLNIDDAAARELEWLIDCITKIRSVRADMNIPAAAKTLLLFKDASPATFQRFVHHHDLLKRIARLEEIAPTEKSPPGSIQTVLGETTLIIPVAGLIDLDKERARLQKEIAALNDNIRKTAAKLGNADFVARAPEEVIEEHRDRLTQDEVSVQKLNQALASLQT